MRAILITGGAGYAGFTITEHLARTYPSTKIVVLDRNVRSCTELLPVLQNLCRNIEIVPTEKADVRNTICLKEVLADYKPDVVINLASKVTNFAKDEPAKNEECLATNFEASVALAKAAKEQGVKVFVQQSSVSVYPPKENLTEEEPPVPATVYGKSKLMGETGALTFNDDSFNVVVFRAATLIGYNLNFKYENMGNIMCIRSVFKVPFAIFESALTGDKTFLDVEDNAQAIRFAIENGKRLGGQIFNLSSFNAPLQSILAIIKETLNEEFPYTVLKESSKNPTVYTVSNEKLRNAGFAPRGALKKTIKNTIERLKNLRDFNSETLIKHILAKAL